MPPPQTTTNERKWFLRRKQMEMVLPEYMRKVYIIISKQIKTNDYTSVSKNIKIVSVHPPPPANIY